MQKRGCSGGPLEPGVPTVKIPQNYPHLTLFYRQTLNAPITKNGHNKYMNRCFQILLISSFVAFSWLAFMVVHEFGHVLTAWLAGGTVERVVLHPLQISWTTLASNPHPQLVAWGGAVWGVVLPAGILVAARLFHSPGLFLFRFFAGFCFIANGFYLSIDSLGGGGDGGTLIQHGVSQWKLLLFGLVTVPCGFWLWHGLGPDFGLGHACGIVSKSAGIVSISLLLITVITELITYCL